MPHHRCNQYPLKEIQVTFQLLKKVKTSLQQAVSAVKPKLIQIIIFLQKKRSKLKVKRMPLRKRIHSLLVLPFNPFIALSYLYCASNNRYGYHDRFSLCINLLSQENHKSIWQSQSIEKRFDLGNVRLSACVLFSSNTYRKLQILNIPRVLKSHYYNMVDHTLIVNNKAWKKEQSQIDSASKERGLWNYRRNKNYSNKF